MSIATFFNLLRWDLRVNHGVSFDSLRAKLLLIEIRIEQFVHRNCFDRSAFLRIFWYLTRFFGSLFQWFLCNSNIPGSVTIGRGLRLPHPQNIIVAGFADFGEFCTIYHNVSIAWNGFKRVKPNSPKFGSYVLLGANAIVIGDVCVGSDVLIGAGALVTKSVPDHSRVVCATPVITERCVPVNPPEIGSERQIRDPYSIWR